MQHAEPSVLISDFLITIVCGFCALRLLSAKIRKSQHSRLFWGFGFLMIAVSSLLGGIFHGFKPLFSEPALNVLWFLTACSIGLAAFFFEYGTVIASCSPHYQKIVVIIAALKFLFFALWTIEHHEYVYVIADYVPALLFVLVLQIRALFRERSRSALWMVAGVITAFIAAAFQQSGFDLHHYFNHNDIYHLFQILGLLFFYSGSRSFVDQQV